MAFNDRWSSGIINPRVNGKSVHAISAQFSSVFTDPMLPIPVTWEVSAAARVYIDKLLMEAVFVTGKTPDQFGSQLYTQIASQQTITVTHTINVS